jgi:hypothetical protein
MSFNNAVDATQTGFQSITAGGVWNGRTLTAGTGINITNGDGTAGSPTITNTGVTTFTNTTPWTPTVTFGGASVGIVYGVQLGWYTQVGDIVTAYFNVTLVNKGTSVGTMAIASLPVTTGASNVGTTGNVQTNSVTFPVATTYLSSSIQTAPGTTLNFFGVGSGITSLILNDTHFVNGSGIAGTIIYTVN